MNARQYAVPYLLSFDQIKRDGYGRPGYCIGTGEAGWAVYKSDDAREVLRFAEALPLHSRMPAHDRAVDDCREGMLRDAAPDLLAALKRMVDMFERHIDGREGPDDAAARWDAARDAIAKATGGAA